MAIHDKSDVAEILQLAPDIESLRKQNKDVGKELADLKPQIGLQQTYIQRQ